jgi:hypothetical protein
VRDQHVERGCGRIVELRPVGDTELLRDIDLHGLDVLTIPRRREQAVGEPQQMQILGRLLTEEVVDPVDLPFIRHGVHRSVQFTETLRATCRTASHTPPERP